MSLARVERESRVNAAELREFGEPVLIQAGAGPAVEVVGIRGSRAGDEESGADGMFEVVRIDDSSLEVPVGRGAAVTLGSVAYTVVKVWKRDRYGLLSLALEKRP